MGPRLNSPPIVEVVCGLFFPAVPGLDPIAVGKFWAEWKKADYPKKQLHPPVTDRPGFVVGDGVGPLRSWLISSTEEYILQMQPDRFYFNWRKRQAEYPHFKDYGEKKGVLTRSLEEFEEFKRFCETELGHSVKAARVELAKIDLLVQGIHFADFRDLGLLVPVAKHVAAMTQSAEPMMHLRLAEARDGHDINFQMTNAMLVDGLTPALQVETRAAAELGADDIRMKFEAMNEIANEVFFAVIDSNQMDRFGGIIQ